LEKARAPKAAAEPVVRKRSDGMLAVGRLGSPHGVQGQLRVHSYSGETAHIGDLDEVDLVREERGLPVTRLHLKVMLAEEGHGGLSLAFEGYSSREKAGLLSGMEIIVDRKKAAPLGENEWYVTDLVGLSLVAPGGGLPYGRVRAVCDGGPDPWLETERPDGSLALVPFRKEFIGVVDVAAGTIELLAPWILE
jgi:16S rRNA processing protein RimM